MIPTPSNPFIQGVTASVINRQTQVDGVLKVTVSGLQRMAIVRLINDEFPSAEVEPIEARHGQSPEAAAPSRAVLDAYQVYPTSIFPLFHRGPLAVSACLRSGNPDLLADTVAPLLSIRIEQRQRLLETSDVVTRLQTILDLMNAGRPTS
jgi:uncharacterized protein